MVHILSTHKLLMYEVLYQVKCLVDNSQLEDDIWMYQTHSLLYMTVIQLT